MKKTQRKDERREIGGRKRERKREGIEKGRAEIGDRRGVEWGFFRIFWGVVCVFQSFIVPLRVKLSVCV